MSSRIASKFPCWLASQYLTAFNNTHQFTKQGSAGSARVHVVQCTASCDQSSNLQNHPLNLVQIKVMIAGNAAAV